MSAASPTGDPVQDFILSIATNLATDVLKFGALRLKIAILGTPEEQAYHHAFTVGFRRLLEQLPIGTDISTVDPTIYTLQKFIRDGEVAEVLLSIALRVRPLPIHLLRSRFNEMGFDTTTLQLSFEDSMNAFTNGLGEGLRKEAQQPNSPLYNRVSQELLSSLTQETRQFHDEALPILRELRQRGRESASMSTTKLLSSAPLLPLAVTPLIGRGDDLTNVLKLLTEHRLVTITGVGGVGKTALAQHVAQQVYEEDKNKPLPRGVVYIALDTLSSGGDLADTVRRTLSPESVPPAQVSELERQEDAVRVTADVLNKGARLLVLDNFESAFQDEEGTVLALSFVRNLITLTGANGVRVLVTGRRALNLSPIETEYPLEPLKNDFGVDLFYARANGAISPNERAVVAEICRLEDYLPLGIELAATAIRKKRRPLKELLSALKVTPLDVDIADALGYPKRQRGLVATLRYTFEHLSPEAKTLFCELSVFKGVAEREAVKFVNRTDSWAQALGELLDWKLIKVNDNGENWYYSMLSTTHAFAALQLLKLIESSELIERELKLRHAEYFLKKTARLSLEEINRENIFQATDWCWSSREWTMLKQFLGPILQYLLSWDRNQFATRCVQGYEAGIRLVSISGEGGTGKTWLANAINEYATRSSFGEKIVVLDFYDQRYRDDILYNELRHSSLELEHTSRILIILDGIEELPLHEQERLGGDVRWAVRAFPHSAFFLTSRKRVDWLPTDIEQMEFVLSGISREAALRMWREIASRYGNKLEHFGEQNFDYIYEVSAGLPLILNIFASIAQRQESFNLDPWTAAVLNVSSILERFLRYLTPSQLKLLIVLARFETSPTLIEIRSVLSDAIREKELSDALQLLGNTSIVREIEGTYVLHPLVKDTIRDKYSNLEDEQGK